MESKRMRGMLLRSLNLGWSGGGVRSGDHARCVLAHGQAGGSGFLRRSTHDV